MPNFPIIDTHLHIWDFSRLNYSAFLGHPLFGKSYQIEDYQRDCENVEVEAMVFLECYADFTPTSGQYIEEIEFVEDSHTRSEDQRHCSHGPPGMGFSSRAHACGNERETSRG